MGLYVTQDKDTYPMLQLFMNTVKHNKINKLIIESLLSYTKVVFNINLFTKADIKRSVLILGRAHCF